MPFPSCPSPPPSPARREAELPTVISDAAAADLNAVRLTPSDSRNERVARYVPAPRGLRGMPDADPGPGHRPLRWRHSVVDDAQAAVARHQVDAILGTGDAEGGA